MHTGRRGTSARQNKTAQGWQSGLNGVDFFLQLLHVFGFDKAVGKGLFALEIVRQQRAYFEQVALYLQA